MIKILNSKLLIPDVTESIKRERLASLLNEASQKTLVNVVAEAGYGKTTLVAQHLRSSTRKAVWYKLDRYDNDLVTFIKYLIAGIGKHYPEFGKETLQRIEDLHTIGSVRKDVFTILASEFEKTIRSDLFIVFDDYHTVPESKEITEAVEFFLEYLPPQVHIIIVSRSIPDLALSRLRSAGKVLDLDTQDLAFTDVEIQQLFRKLFDIHLPSGSLKILEEKTGGWVAALMLFYLHSKGKAPREIEKQIKDLKGSLQLYSNYMDENIFGRLSENTKDFLTKTSVLSRLNADFCDRFLKQSNSRDILHELEKSHIFTFALDDERKWYCYHQLFQDYLLAKLQSDLSKKAVQKLHEEAAGLLELAEEPEVALDHYLQAERYEQVCRLMDKTASAWLREGRLQLVGSYLKRIPQKLVKSQAWYHRVQPRLLELTDSLQAAVDGYQEAHGFFRDRNSREDSDNCLLAVGRIHLMNGNFEIAGKKLEKLIKNKTLSPNHRIEALGNLIYIASFSNKAIVADQYLEETLSLLPKGERSSREYLAGLTITLCHKHFNTNDFEKAAQLGAKALELSKTIRRTPYLIGCYYYTSLAFSAQGKFREGLETADQGLQLIEENKLCGGLNHCMILHCLAENSTGIGNTDQAIHYATESLEYARI
ncbi:MAG: hypothetical protein GY866_29000 [Proteobacteria bacterium]|nr:hypothetical protein [Pseudomonadota bacterium]